MYQVLRIMYLKKIFLLFILTTYYILHATVSPAGAQTMTNQNYILKTQGFNAVSGVTKDENYNLRSNVREFTPISGEGVNFRVKTGFENTLSSLPFSISLSSNLVDYGIISPTDPIIRTVDLGINSLNVYGFSVMVSENDALATTSPSESDTVATKKVIIPDTTCDSGICGTENAAQWTNTLTYGLGYRCDNISGVDCDNSFIKPNSYKHFPNIANNDDPQSIMSGIGANNKGVRISYKVNISGTQPQGIYSNIITYIAVPNF